ncbi:MAG: YigZ family protein [Clostridia bacterium]|jgi:uncharacterized YigZ family protein|nr:YigZ family protein [Clostridia bacterium]MCI9413519.1 YigZ family protein [Clostridia bacterium]
MKTIEKEVSAEIVEKKSKFIGNLFYVENVKEAEAKLEEIRKKYHDARHHCFAYRIIEDNHVVERANDDGEPSGTAGAPMLQLLSKNEIVNSLVVVTRYFGGILLGTGGLVRAYSQATAEAMQKAKWIGLEKGEVIKLSVSYQNLAYLQYYCKKNDISILETNFDKEPYSILEIAIDKKGKFLHKIEEKQFCIQKMEVLQEKYIQKKVQENA